MVKTYNYHIGATLLFLTAIAVISLVIPIQAGANYSYGNSGTGLMEPNHFPGLEIGPIEQFVNGPTNQLNAWVKNVSSTTKVVALTKATCRCQESIGYPFRTGLGQCQYYWDPLSTSNPRPACITATEDVTLAPGQSYLVTRSVSQFEGQSCGSFQIDFNLNSINGVPTSETLPWGASFANLGQDCQNPAIACRTNTDCGTNGLTGNNFCQNNAVYRNFTTYTCNNPGTPSSYCSNSSQSQLQTQCTSSQMCSNGSCVNNPTLSASCTAFPNPAQTNQPVSFSGNAIGGTGSYTYSWTGACNGFSQNCSNTFSNSGSQTAFLQVTSGGQTANASCSVSVSQACTQNDHKQCVGNSVYWYDSCGNQGSLYQICSQNQICSNGSCQNQNNLTVSCSGNPNPVQLNQTATFTAYASGGTGSYYYNWTGDCNGSSQNCSVNPYQQRPYTASVTVTSGSYQAAATCTVNVSGINQYCTPNARTQCVGNSVYWYDSCGNQGSLYQICSQNQICSNGSCQNQNQNVTLSINKTVENLTGGVLNYTNSVYANPNDIVQFRIIIQNNSNQVINNITLKDIFPTNLSYYNNLVVDGVANGSNIISGLSIPSLNAGQSTTITYQAQVAPDQNFSFGTTTLTNFANLTSSSYGLNPLNASASVIVTKTGIHGATSVSTGWSNNMLADTFLIPIALTILAAWWINRGNKKVPSWVGKK